MTTADSDKEAIDTAWRIHGAIESWTGKVDAKASFALAVESGLLVAAGGFTKSNSLFGKLDTAQQKWSFGVGIGLLFLAVLAAGSVVKPRLRRLATRREWKDGFIYFGHLRKWDAADLATRLRSLDLLPALSRQLVVTSRIAWRKHVFVQASLWLALGGFVSLGLCAYLGLRAR